MDGWMGGLGGWMDGWFSTPYLTMGFKFNIYF